MKKKDVHQSCPNKGHCSKDEKHCCYLIKRTNKCYLDSEQSESYL